MTAYAVSCRHMYVSVCMHAYMHVHTYILPLAAGHHKEYEEHTVSDFTIFSPTLHIAVTHVSKVLERQSYMWIE